MISLPVHLVSFFKKVVASRQEPSTSSGSETGVCTGVPTELDDHELQTFTLHSRLCIIKTEKEVCK